MITAVGARPVNFVHCRAASAALTAVTSDVAITAVIVATNAEAKNYSGAPRTLLWNEILECH